MEKAHIVIFALIIFGAIFLRFYQLDAIPPGVNRDEASIGYTAYSLLHTGKDEYKRSFPLSFQSFGDWKLPVYIYATTLTVSLLGLSELAVRLPSAIFGTATVALTFFLAFELLQSRRLALLTMLFAAIAPWHIHLSRAESESNTAVFFITLAVFLFLKSLKGRSWVAVPSLILFALTYFTYAGNYIFTTLLLLGMLFIYRSSIPKTKTFFAAGAIFILLFGFISFQTMFGNQTKFSGIGIFGDPAIVHAKIELPRNEHTNGQNIFARLSHNRIMFALERFGQNYLASFSPEFLFIKGGENNAHNIANFGNMYLIEAPFLFFGLLFLMTRKMGREKKLIVWWFFVAPIAASITKDAPHTNRMFAIFPMLSIAVALGIYWTVTCFRQNLFRNITMVTIAVFFVGNIGLYLDRYFVHFPRNEGKNWGIGFKKLSEVLEREPFKDKKVVITHPETSPYIFLLFYQRYDPKKYQESAVRYSPTEDGFVHVASFDRYEFRDSNLAVDLMESHTVMVAKPSEVSDFVKNVQYRKVDIMLPNGETVFVVVEKTQ